MNTKENSRLWILPTISGMAIVVFTIGVKAFEHRVGSMRGGKL